MSPYNQRLLDPIGRGTDIKGVEFSWSRSKVEQNKAMGETVGNRCIDQETKVGHEPVSATILSIDMVHICASVYNFIVRRFVAVST